MSEISDRYRRLSATFADKIAAVPPDRWAAATPCTEWSARDLVRHVVETPGMFFGLVGRELRPGPSMDDDPLGAELLPAASSSQVDRRVVNLHDLV